MTAIGAIRPCVRGIFVGPAAEAVWGISDPKKTFDTDQPSARAEVGLRIRNSHRSFRSTGSGNAPRCEKRNCRPTTAPIRSSTKHLHFAIPWSIYKSVYTQEIQMATARVFRSGNSQAVRLPKEFRLKGKEVEIFRRGDEIVLREKGKGLARAFEILAHLPDDFLPEGRQDTPPQEREGL
jgi:antitoxin VapB